MMLLLLTALSAQAGVFEDREAGFAVRVPVGWELVYAGTDGRAALRRPDEPSVFLLLASSAQDDEEIGAGRWDAYRERYLEVLAARLPGFEVRRHAAAGEGEPPAFDLWFGSGKDKTAVETFVRTLAVPGRLLIASGTAARGKWEAQRESIEAVLRSAAFLPPAKDAGAVWTDPARGFSIAVPAAHRVRPEQRGATAVSIFGPDGVTNLNVVVQGAERNFAALSEKDLRAHLEGMMKKQIQGFAYVDFAKTTWNGLAAIRTSAEFAKDELPLSNLQFGTSTAKRSYYLTWSSRRELFEKRRPDFEASLKTFALTAVK
jgi:hypothetical protein